MARLTHTELMHNSFGSNAASVTSNWVQAATGTGAVVWTPMSGGGAASFGSNATDVSSVSAGGASTNSAREDHLHRGVHLLTSNTSNTLYGDVNLQAGSGIALGVAAQTITISNIGSGGGGSGSGVTIKYPALKPATPTDDFATSTLGGGYTAHSSGGTFVTGNCMTQGVDWVGSSVEFQFSEQFGGLYTTHADSDLDFTWGGVNVHLPFHEATSSEVMVGIAALNSAGTGIAVLSYTADTNAYLAAITAWQYVSNSDSWAGRVMGTTGTGSNESFWYRLKRVSGTWTGYISKSGRTWDKTFATRADAVTVDRLFFGLLYDNTKVYSGRLTADYYQLDV